MLFIAVGLTTPDSRHNAYLGYFLPGRRFLDRFGSPTLRPHRKSQAQASTMQSCDTKARAGRNSTSTKRTKTTPKVGNVATATSTSKRSRPFSDREKLAHLQYWFSEIWQQGTKGQEHVDQVRRLVRERLQDMSSSTPSLTESAKRVAKFKKRIDYMKKSRLRSKKKRKRWFPPIAERVSAAIGSSKSQFSKWWKTAVLEGKEESLPAILRQELGEAPAAIENFACSGMAQGEGIASSAASGKGDGRKLGARPRRSRIISKSNAVCPSSPSEKPRKGQRPPIATAPPRSLPMDKAGGRAPSSAHAQLRGISITDDPQLAVEVASSSVDLVRARNSGAASGPPALDGTTEEFGSVLSADTMSQGSMSPGLGGSRSIAFARQSPSQWYWPLPVPASHLLRVRSFSGGGHAASAAGAATMSSARSPIVPQATNGFGWSCGVQPGAASPRYPWPSSSTSSSSTGSISSNGDYATLLATDDGVPSSTSDFGMLGMPQAAAGAHAASTAALGSGVGVKGTQIATSCQPGHTLPVRPERLRAWNSLQYEIEHEISGQTESTANHDVVEILADKPLGSGGPLLGSVGLADAVVARGAGVNDTAASASGRESAATEDSVDSAVHLIRDDGPRGSSGFFSIGINTGITGADAPAIGSVRPRPIVASSGGCASSGEPPSKKGRNR